MRRVRPDDRALSWRSFHGRCYAAKLAKLSIFLNTLRKRDTLSNQVFERYPKIGWTMQPQEKLPRISVLMPVFNNDRYIVEAIESILNQTESDFEFVIVDDGSTDRTSAILRDYETRDTRIRVIRQKNGGIVSALNTGMRFCRGEYIARMDGDDISYPNRFNLQLDYLDNNPDCVVVGGVFMSIDEEGTNLAPYRFVRNKVTSFRSFPIQVALTVHPLAMIRKEALVALAGYRATFPHAEDYDLFIRISKYGRLHNLDEILLSYRNHHQSISRRNIELQEAAMAYAEFAALSAYRNKFDLVKPQMDFESVRREVDKMFSRALVEAYVEFRIWRRIGAYDRAAARARLGNVIRSLLSLSPETLISYDYWRLRRRTCGRLILNAMKAMRLGRPEQLKSNPP
jgi:glycosyltransferase involved in cell wall biosynthesis